MEERGTDTSPAPGGGEAMATKLQRLADKARSDPKLKFTSVYHLLNEELLRGCFERLRRDAAAGIDQMTKDEYAQGLPERLAALARRLQQLGWRPQPVRRVYIPKPGGDKQRPLGIPCLEDKLVQSALARILEQVYEQDFVEDSYGFRPGRGCHDALRALNRTVASGRVNWIVEADIKGFFDHVDHDWLMKFLGHRIGDPRMHRLVRRLLKAGIMEQGQLQESETGVPQGGSVSPLMGNVYLHYALDLWFERRFGPGCGGEHRLIRYADDFVACFEREADAVRFREELGLRLAQFGLEVEASKTKVLAFGPQAEQEARRQGQNKPETFDFLGLTHYCTHWPGSARFRLGRVTARKKFRAKLAELKQWLRKSRTRPTRELWATFCAKLRGHFAYYGVTGNCQGIGRFAQEAKELLYKWLNRRGGRRRLSWEKLNLMNRRFPLPRPLVRVSLV